MKTERKEPIRGSSLCLSTAELWELTGYRNRKLQIAALDFMGYDYRINPRGDVKVLRSALTATGTQQRRRDEPNFDAL